MPSVTALEPDGLQFAVLHPVVERAAHRVGEHDAHAPVAVLLQRARHAAERAARAGGADERVEPAFGLAPDLGAGGRVMRLTVRRVVELVAAHRARNSGGHARRELLVVIRIGIWDGLHHLHLRAERAQQPLLLRRLVVGHHDHAAIPARVAKVRKPDAGVAGRTLDQRAARRQQPLALERVEDALGRAVLHRAARVQELRLAENLAARLVAERVETNERRVADGAGHAGANLLRHASQSSVTARPATRRHAGRTDSVRLTGSVPGA